MKQFPKNVSDVIHFVGIGGIGMSGIADILINLGYRVTGSDIKENTLTSKLSRKGVLISYDHNEENVKNASVVVVSSAISLDNPEIVAARKMKIPVIKRAEMLAELMKMKSSIAIAGTHGKTTLTSMISAILDQANFDPTVINGGVINAYNSNSHLGDGEWMVVEADESDGSFTKLMSTIAVVTSIDFDHGENFENFQELKNMFLNFVEHIPFYGAAVLCVDHPEVQEIANKLIDRKVITYGFAKSADVSAINYRFDGNSSIFDVVFPDNIWKNFSLSMSGKHNIQNALAAISVAVNLGISEKNIRIALGSFMGVRRRFTEIALINNVKIIDDYAHHPVETTAVLKTAKSIFDGNVIAVMQPHRYSRLKRFLDDFAKSLIIADYVFVTKIFAAGESSGDVDHYSLLREIEKISNKKAFFVKDVDDLYEKTYGILKEKDAVVFMGAGDITNWAVNFSKILEKNQDLHDRKY